MHDDMMVAFSKLSGTVVWMRPWQNWPRLVPADINTMAVRMRAAPPDLAPLVDGFGVGIDYLVMGYEPSTLDHEDMDRLRLQRRQCDMSWKLLEHAQGLGPNDAWDMLDAWYNRIWQANSQKDLDELSLAWPLARD